jgi:acyl homoserine lactone synthase
MLRYLYGNDLPRFPRLAHSMFTDRAAQFAHRLGWAVSVNAAGEERDQYDGLNPLYLIWQRDDGLHGGSMRFLPTTGRTMVNEHFNHLNGGEPIASPLIWECTRFCLAPGGEARAAAALALGAGELMASFGLEHFVGVFEARMERVYARIGLRPEVLGRAGVGREAVGVGLWSMNAAAFAPTLAKVGISRATSRRWLREGLHAASVVPPIPELAQTG